MFSTSTSYSLVAQLARLVTTHPKRGRERPAARLEPASDGCGCCPVCGEFIFIEFAEGDACVDCPRCAALIDGVEPLGGGTPEAW